MKLSDVTIHRTADVRIVTSGYSDRYTMCSARILATVRTDDGGEFSMEWTSIDTDDRAVKALAALTGEPWRACYDHVHAAPQHYRSHWELSPTSSRSGPVRHHVISAIASLASHESRTVGSLSDAAVAKFREEAREATEDERACARYWLSECNRLSARTGREQVAIPAWLSESA